MTDYTVGDTVYTTFTTRAFATGIPTVLAGTPGVSAIENDSATPITAGITLGVSHASVVGLNLLTIVATGGNGFEAGKDYNLYIDAGTVGGVSVVGETVGSFSLGRSAAAVDLDNGTDGLGALKALIDAVKADTVLPEKNVAFSNIPVFMVDSTDHVSPKTGLTLSVTRSLDSAAFGAATGTAAEVSSGMYQFDASQADMNADSITFRFTAAGADDRLITIFTR